jgi:hypothetical protein
MRSLSVSRPTPAFILALVALVFAMAGTGYAASTISGKSLKKRSTPADRIVSNSLTGTQVKESALGLVPKAQLANLASTANTANSAKTAQLADAAKTALTADSAKTALTADTATTATTADKAKDADKLGNRLPSAYLRSARVVRTAVFANVAVNATVEVAAVCTPDEVAVGGGGGWFIAGTDTSVASATLSASTPQITSGQMVGWRVEGKNTSTVVRDARAYAICLPTG